MPPRSPSPYPRTIPKYAESEGDEIECTEEEESGGDGEGGWCGSCEERLLEVMVCGECRV